MPNSTVRRWLLLAAVFSLGGCADGSLPGNPSRELDLPQLLSALPPLPDDRGSSAVHVTEINGKDTFNRALNAIDNGQALDLLSGINSTSWAIWWLNPPLAVISEIEVVIDVPDNEHVWLALSDFARGTWDIDGPLAAGKALVPNEARHRSASGNLYVAAIAQGGSQPTVQKLMLSTDNGWAIVHVDTEGNVGGSTSLAVVDGGPAISYYSFSDTSLKYASSSTTTGSSAEDWSVITLDSAGEVGNYSSLAEVEGQPAISYQDWSNSALKYARRGPGDIWTAVTVRTSDTGERVGEFTSLAVVNGYPLITHFDSDGGRLLHAQSITPTGMLEADWQNYVTDNDDDSVGKYNSLAVVDGKAAVSYFNSYTVNGLRYKWFSDPTKVRVASPYGEARYTSLAVVDGRPAISWYDTGTGYLRYSFSSSVHGTSNADWSTITLDLADNDNSPTSLAVIAGQPAICYSRRTSANSNQLYFAWSSTANGWNPADWRLAVVDDSSLYTGGFASLTEVDGKPAVSYYDASDGDLKYAIRLGP